MTVYSQVQVSTRIVMPKTKYDFIKTHFIFYKRFYVDC